MNTTQSDELAHAITYLEAKEVAPGRYAVKSRSRYYVMRRDTITSYAGLLKQHHVEATDPTDDVLMPKWWTPEYPFALRNAAGEIAALYRTRETAFTGMIHGDRVITADLETGEEISA